MLRTICRYRSVSVLFAAIAGWTASAPVRAVEFDVRLDPAVAKEPVSGRLYVFLTRDPKKEPRGGIGWFDPEPFFGLDVKAMQPGATCRIDDSADGFPGKLSKLAPGHYRAQALLAHNFQWAEQGNAPGNQYSSVVDIDVAAGSEPTVAPVTVPLVLDQIVPEKTWPDISWIKQVAIESPLLSKFHHRRVMEYAGVVLPAGYDEHPDRRYPVIYEVTGFGGTYWQVVTTRKPKAPPTPGPGETDFIRVTLDGQCLWGHHCYADSPVNGPRGQALVSELIPEIDRRFRTVANAKGRFVTGHSSGGWSSLWLQVTYPDTFNGVWSTSPDPVDFRDFQLIDLYADPPLNMFTDPQGNRRPIARRGAVPAVWYENFSRMDDVLKYGGQLRSFEAVFSPADANGEPRKLWDRQTGRIDPEVAKAWRPYDIGLRLQNNWPDLAPRLRGKLHIATGSLDTFYLNGAVEKLAETLKRLGSDAQITIVPGADHGRVRTPDYIHQMNREATARYEEK